MWTAGGLALVAALHAPTAAPEPWYEQLATPVGPVCVARDDGAGAEWHEARAAWDAALRDLFPRDPLPADKGSALALAGLDRVLMLTFCDAAHAADPAPVERGVSDFLAHFPRDPRAPEAIFVRGVARLRAGQIDAGLADLAQVSREAPTAPVAPRARIALGDHHRGRDELFAARTHYEAVLATAGLDAGPRAYAALRLFEIARETGAPDADAFRTSATQLVAGREDPLGRFVRARLEAPQTPPKPVSASPGPP
jgi:hypothetical protein